MGLRALVHSAYNDLAEQDAVAAMMGILAHRDTRPATKTNLWPLWRRPTYD